MAYPQPASRLQPKHRLFEEVVPIRPSSGSAQSTSPTTTTTTTTTTVSSPPSSSGASPLNTLTVRGIEIKGWTIRTVRGAIADSSTIDVLSDTLRIPMPEMPFPHNALIIEHPASGFLYVFDGVRALRSVDGVERKSRLEGMDLRGDASKEGTRKRDWGDRPKKKGIKVAYADEWGKKRDQAGPPPPADESNASTSNFGPDVAAHVQHGTIATARDYDWTYSTTWAGHESKSPPSSSSAKATSGGGLSIAELLEPSPSSSSSPAATAGPASSTVFRPASDPATDRIPVERLGPSSGEPILFYDDVVLFEDELGDNGSAVLSVKVRVMPTGFLVLQRFFLRVDEVLFRLFDTRMYGEFGGAPPSSSSSSSQAGQAAGVTAAPWAAAMPDLSKLDVTRGQEQVKAESGARIIRECSGCEASYADVKARLPAWKPNDLSPLTDPNWVAQTLQLLSTVSAQRSAASGKWAASGMGASATAVGQTGVLPLPGSATGSASPSTSAGEYRPPGTMPLSACAPAVLPVVSGPTAAAGGSSTTTHEGNRILGEVDVEMDGAGEATWEGQGSITEVAEIVA